MSHLSRALLVLGSFLLLVACDPVLHPDLPDPIAANADAICIAPSVPTGLALEVDEGKIVLHWQISTEQVAGYVLERRLFLDPTWGELIRIDDAEIHDYDDDSATLLDAQYGYRLRAYRQVGDIQCASPASEEMVATTFPKAPERAQVVAYADRIELSWRDPNDFETAYRIERRRQQLDRGFERVAELERNETIWVDPDPVPGHIYDYHIYALNRSGASQSVSLSAPAILAARVPNAPQLSWTGAPELDAQCGLRQNVQAIFDKELGASYDASQSNLSIEQALTLQVVEPTEAEQSFALMATMPPMSGQFSTQWNVADSLGGSASIERRLQMTSERSPLVRDRLPSPTLGDDDAAGRQVLLPGCSTCQGTRGSLAVGGMHSCVVTDAGRVKCWGYNGWGQRGNGVSWEFDSPVRVCSGAGSEPCSSALSDIADLGLGSGVSCVVNDSGDLKCWGDSYDAKLGLGQNSSQTQYGYAQNVCQTGMLRDGSCSTFTNVNRVVVSAEHACALRNDGTVACWGKAGDGRLGMGVKSEALRPHRVCQNGSEGACAEQLHGVTQLGLGDGFSCALTELETVRCWGNNYYGQIGDGSKTDAPVPVDVCARGTTSEGTCVQMTGVESIAISESSSCAVLSGGRLACWGNNNSGQLGLGADADYSYVNPQLVCASGSVAGEDCNPLTGVDSVALGYAHACALQSGSVFCWGSGSYHRLGNGTTERRDNPTPVCLGGIWDGSACVDEIGQIYEELKNIDQLSLGQNHSCALAEDGRVFCWGNNDDGQLGNGTWSTSPLPQTVCLSGSHIGEDCIELTNVRRLVSGVGNSCAFLQNGGIWCWGDNYWGELGDGTDTSRNNPVQICESGAWNGTRCDDAGATSTLMHVVDIALGEQHSCASLSDGTSHCWGRAAGGMFGDGLEHGSYDWSPNPVPVCLQGNDASCVTSNNFSKLSSWAKHNCALTDEGYVWCWGDNGDAQLGDGYRDKVDNPSNVCLSGGGVECQPLANIESIALGSTHSCALDADQELWCWGDNYYGGLGNGDDSDSVHPVGVCLSGQWDGVTCSGERLGQIVQVAAGNEFSCALDSLGQVQCWGSNSSSELGNQGGGYELNPVLVCDKPSNVGSCDVLTVVDEIALGYQHGCALIDRAGEGRVVCWGKNSNGQLGQGDFDNRDGASELCVQGSHAAGNCQELTGVTQIAAYGYHSCAIKANGEVLCWGSDDYGVLGRGDGDSSSASHPANVCMQGSVSGDDCVPLNDAQKIQIGSDHACAVRANGDLWCWGDNNKGEIGVGSLIEGPNPEYVCATGVGPDCVPLEGVLLVTAGWTHSCALMQDQRVMCWGNGSEGQLGDGGWRDSSFWLYRQAHPHEVCLQGSRREETCEALHDVVALSSGGNNSCALLGAERRGQLMCWGQNNKGQVGDGTAGGEASGYTNFVPVRPNPVYVCASGRGQGCTPEGGFVSVDTGSNATCAVTEAGKLRCWGDNSFGQLGNGMHGEAQYFSQQVCASGRGSSCPALTGVRSVSLGWNHACAVLNDGHLACWGDNRSGQLGEGTQLEANWPQSVCLSGSGSGCETLNNVKAVTSSDVVSCAVLGSGEVYCWGGVWDENYLSWVNGRVGDGQWQGSNTPVSVCASSTDRFCSGSCEGSLQDVVAIASGSYYEQGNWDVGESQVCVLKSSGQVQCWGANKYGQLGMGTAGEYHRCTPESVCTNGQGRGCINGETMSLGELATCDLYSVLEVQ